jgi:glycosyltransferase involved in cell wall biosynthesis
MPKLIRITTLPVSLQVLLKGQMRYMKAQGFEVVMLSSEGPEVKALEIQEGCPHVVVPLTRKISPWADLVCLVKLVRLFRKLKPDIVHTHTPKAGLLGMWAAKLAGVPVRLHTIAGLPWVESTGFMRSLLRFIEKLTVMAACQVYPNSFVQQRFLLEQHFPARKLKVLGKGSSNGINSDYFSLNEEIAAKAGALKAAENVAKGAWIWIFIGRLVKDKGLGELLDAFSALHKEFPADRLWLLGSEEPDLDPLGERHRQILHNHPAIKCWGFQNDIRPYLAAAKVLVFPSYREGFPNVPLQAGSMGCMLILSDINGCNEIVQHNVNGVLVEPKNTARLAESMFNNRNTPRLQERFSMAIRQKIKEDYGQEKLWKILQEEYLGWMQKKNIRIS